MSTYGCAINSRKCGRAIVLDALRRSCTSLAASTVSVAAGSQYSRSEEHTSELQSLMRISYAVFCLKKNNNKTDITTYNIINIKEYTPADSIQINNKQTTTITQQQHNTTTHNN